MIRKLLYWPCLITTVCTCGAISKSFAIEWWSSPLAFDWSGALIVVGIVVCMIALTAVLCPRHNS